MGMAATVSVIGKGTRANRGRGGCLRKSGCEE
jgi:hypothetical protein